MAEDTSQTQCRRRLRHSIPRRRDCEHDRARDHRELPDANFLPNERALEPQQRDTYLRFGLSDRQIEIIGSAFPKRDYYLQSSKGARLFELGLGPVALALCGASSTEDQKSIDRVLTGIDGGDFAERYLTDTGHKWASDLLSGWAPQPNEGDIT